MTATPRAIFIEEPRDPASLEQVRAFGRPFILFAQGMKRPSIMDIDAFADAVRRELLSIKYDSTFDYIVLTGAQVTLLFSALAIASRHDTIRLLVFHAPTSDYVEKVWGGRKDTARCKRSTAIA